MTFLPRAALILFSFCRMITSCTKSPIINKLPFGGSSTCETLRLEWNCLNSPITDRHVLNVFLIPLIITGILFLVMKGLGQTWVSGGCSEELVFCRVGSIGELIALCFLRLRFTSVNLYSWLTDCMIKSKCKTEYVGMTQRNYKLS